MTAARVGVPARWPAGTGHCDHLVVRASGPYLRPCLLDSWPTRSGDVRTVEDGWRTHAADDRRRWRPPWRGLTLRQGGRLTGPRQARGQAGAGRARLGASWGGHEKARQAAPAGAKCEPVWASRAVEEREPGTRMAPAGSSTAR